MLLDWARRKTQQIGGCVLSITAGHGYLMGHERVSGWWRRHCVPVSLPRGYLEAAARMALWVLAASITTLSCRANCFVKIIRKFGDRILEVSVRRIEAAEYGTDFQSTTPSAGMDGQRFLTEKGPAIFLA